MDDITRWYASELDPKKTKDDGQERSDAVFAELRRLDAPEETRRLMVAKYIGLYENREITSLEPGKYPVPEGKGDLTLNVCQSSLDTVAGKIATKKPKPLFVTDGGNNDQKTRAEGMQKFTMGNLHEGRVYEKIERVFYNAAIGGSGYLRPYYDEGRKKIAFDVVFCTDIIVDEQTAMDGIPRVLFHRKMVPSDVLASRYPKFKDHIEKQVSEGVRATTNLIEVIEAFHLRSGPKERDGLWTICCQGVTLEDNQWDKDEHDFCKFDWTKRIRGFNGQGLMEQLHGIQVEITTLLQGIQENFALHSMPWLMNHVSTKINNSMFNNERGNIFDWEGNIPPDLKVFMTTHPEVFQHLWNLFQKAYEIAGISEMSARGVKPAGLESGRALREMQDTETRRFGIISASWDRFILDISRKIIALAREHPKLTVKWADGTKYEDIQFEDISLEEDKYVMRLWPTNLLPDTPSGQYDTTSDMVNSGIITPEQAAGLLAGYPDLKSVTDSVTAPRDHYDVIISHMLTTGEYIPPEIWQPIPLGISMMRTAWMEGVVAHRPQEEISILIRWLTAAQEMQKKEQVEMQSRIQAEAMKKAQPQQAPGQPPAGPPQGPPPMAG